MAEHRAAARLACVAPSATGAVTQLYRARLRAGEDIIGLSVGEPDFETPAHICEAAAKAMADGQTRYTDVGGTPAFKEAVVEKVDRDYRLVATPDMVIAGAGAKQVIFNALMATINPGDEVIVLTPGWVSYTEVIRLLGGIPVIVEASSEADLVPSLESIRAALTSRTKWVILNSPCNPTGSILPEALLAAIADAVMKHSAAWILSDDVYEHIRFDGTRAHVIAQSFPEAFDRTLLVNSLSKAYAMTGWRVGYGVGPSALISDMVKIQSHSTTNASSISQAAAVAALRGPQVHLDAWNSEYVRRRDAAINVLSTCLDLQITTPKGAFYLYVGCARLLGQTTETGRVLRSDVDVAEYLLANGVACVPGSAFGKSPYIRLSFAAPLKQVTEGCKRIIDSVRRIRSTSGRGDS